MTNTNRVIKAEDFGVTAGGDAKANSKALRMAFLAAKVFDGPVEIEFPIGIVDLEDDPFDVLKSILDAERQSKMATILRGVGRTPFDTELRFQPKKITPENPRR